jgi:hypothetical protein
MSDRRHLDRPERKDRRSFPRPPLWLNLLLIVLGIGGLWCARYHRERVSTEFADVLTREQRTPADVTKIKEELAEMDLSRESLQHELDGRMKFVNSLKSENFYLSIDTKARKLRFHYGDTVLREADVVPGETKTLSADGKTWTFIPLKGAFPIEAKLVDHAWNVPEWVYAMNRQPVPAERPVVTDGLGKYVLFLPNGYAIHTQPAPDSPLQGAKPGSYMVSEDVLRAIWPRIVAGKTQVYIF